jgi:hypothetical protein
MNNCNNNNGNNNNGNNNNGNNNNTTKYMSEEICIENKIINHNVTDLRTKYLQNIYKI